jgi:hypothetical protein
MTIFKRTVPTCLLAALFLASPAAPAIAQGDQTASAFYMNYRAAFDKAKTIDELLPFMSAARRKEIESTPAAERAKMFEMVKAFGAMSQVKVGSETKTANGATLAVSAVDSDKAKMQCTITMLREANSWKIERESCKSGG